jgi:hypothetical protein
MGVISPISIWHFASRKRLLELSIILMRKTPNHKQIHFKLLCINYSHAQYLNHKQLFSFKLKLTINYSYVRNTLITNNYSYTQNSNHKKVHQNHWLFIQLSTLKESARKEDARIASKILLLLCFAFSTMMAFFSLVGISKKCSRFCL